MQPVFEKKIILYSSLLVALLMNIPKLLQVRGNGWVSQFVTFNLPEVIFQLGYNFLFCWLTFELNLRWFPRLRPGKGGTGFAVYPLWNFGLLLLFSAIGIFTQRHLFADTSHLPLRFYRATYFARLGLSLVLVMLMVRIIYLLRQAQARELETEQLKSRYLRSELELMKQHLNPHFFFNSLSTLSGIVRENPARAQQFISHLSRIFRNLLQEQQQLIPLKDELQQLHSFTELLQMRFEEGIVIKVEVPVRYLDRQVPHLSLQLLIENAAKHNRASATQPLRVEVFVQDEEIWVRNNLQPVHFPQEYSGKGLLNLNERCRILLKKEITILRTDQHFIVKIPLHA
ncbi:sensor histidine kinase [Chitinophaga japonensis]|uniref:Histidine kinase n=1 Tax=Chitinophaga japonensis TaxID=104662 RepID=A0A562T6P6_CHIJA|nr:histidine kinase [Chitinophaga japonensis]TWI88924.1 histidine kinase [Chitinophaga japonensis]